MDFLQAKLYCFFNIVLYSSADYLQDIISENIPPAKSKIKSSFEFHNKLMTIDKIEIIVSLDVTFLCSLMLNIAGLRH